MYDNESAYSQEVATRVINVQAAYWHSTFRGSECVQSTLLLLKASGWECCTGPTGLHVTCAQSFRSQASMDRSKTALLWQLYTPAIFQGSGRLFWHFVASHQIQGWHETTDHDHHHCARYLCADGAARKIISLRLSSRRFCCQPMSRFTASGFCRESIMLIRFICRIRRASQDAHSDLILRVKMYWQDRCAARCINTEAILMSANLCASYEENKAGHSADAVEARHIREVVKVITDVVLQEPHAGHLTPRLQHAMNLT